MKPRKAGRSLALSKLLLLSILMVTAGCGDEGSSTALPSAAVVSGTATATGGAAAAATTGTTNPATTANPATTSATSATSATTSATTVQCQELNAVLYDFGLKMLESTERDPARRAHLEKEMKAKNDEFMDRYLDKCTSLTADGVICATAAMRKADTEALLTCPIDLAELEPDIE